MRLLRVALLLCSILNIPFQLSAKTLHVGAQRSIKSIKVALQEAQHGDTILVDAGLYKEGAIVVQKSVYLKGIQYPVLDGESKHEVLVVKGNNITIEGFKLQNTGRSEIKDIGALMIYDSYKVTALRNIVDNANFGISVQNSKSCILKENKIKAYGKNEVQSGNGIHCWKSDSLLIIANDVSGHRDGIYFEFVTNSLVWRNRSYKNVRYGIHFMFSHHDTYIANIFEENESGVAVMYTKYIYMYNNYFMNNWGAAAYGILLKDITDSEISGNVFQDNTAALNMEACSRINLYKNTFSNNGFAVKIQASCDNNNFYHNNFTANTFDIATNGTLVLNTFNGNYWDKYEGYDLNKDKIGDVPYHPVSLYSMIIESNQAALMLFRSLIVTLIDKSEKLMPGLTPENLRDQKPYMKPLKL